MTSRTEQAVAAMTDQLDRALIVAGFGHPSRNEDIDSQLQAIGEEVDSGDGISINIVDGNQEGEPTAYAGADNPEMADGYDIDHVSQIEIIVLIKDATRREAQFDAIVETIASALEADRTLGNVVSWVALRPIDRSFIKKDALPVIKCGVLPVCLSFTSNRPF